ncbi:MAG: hypothetical protein R3B45_01175 [Bdellovibrionota bacterium]
MDGSEYEQCSRASEDCFDYGGGWVTVVFDPDGEPLLISIQPDDNNTGIKYANQSKMELTQVFLIKLRAEFIKLRLNSKMVMVRHGL